MSGARAFLAALREEIDAHPAVNHLLLNRLATSPFSRDDYRVLADHHVPLVCVFTIYLELLLLRAPDSEARLWLAKVLVDEYGEGSEGHDHATLYQVFRRAAGGVGEHLGSLPVPPPARAFIDLHLRLVRQSPFPVGLGAVGPGHEWAIPRMFESLLPGLRRAGFAEDEIAYFTLHVQQDADHGAWLEEALARYADTAERQAQVRQGAMASLAARGRFWDGVQQAIVRYRQPRNIRQDTAEARSLPRELATTLWDGLPLARRLEGRLDAARQRVAPDVDTVMRRARRVSGPGRPPWPPFQV